VDVEGGRLCVTCNIWFPRNIRSKSPREVGMEPLLVHVGGGKWRYGHSLLPFELAFERIQRGSAFKVNGRIFKRDGTLWTSGEELWTPMAIELLLQTLD